jgi:hypothetical protein
LDEVPQRKVQHLQLKTNVQIALPLLFLVPEKKPKIIAESEKRKERKERDGAIPSHD